MWGCEWGLIVACAKAPRRDADGGAQPDPAAAGLRLRLRRGGSVRTVQLVEEGQAQACSRTA